MSRISTQEFKLEVPEGHVYARKWSPENPSFDVPLVLLHDSLGSVDLWREFPQSLAKQLSRSVIAYDRLGFGKSAARTTLPSIHFIEEEATDYFPYIKQQLGIDRYLLLGHSVGGAMSINIAARDADCQGVITMAAQAFVEQQTISEIARAKTLFAQPGQLERLQKWHGENARWVLNAWTDVWLNPEFANWSLESSISDVKCPILALHGEEDEYGSVAFPEFIAGKSRGPAAMHVLKQCGHMPHKEKTEEVISSIRDFLGQYSVAA